MDNSIPGNNTYKPDANDAPYKLDLDNRRRLVIAQYRFLMESNPIQAMLPQAQANLLDYAVRSNSLSTADYHVLAQATIAWFNREEV